MMSVETIVQSQLDAYNRRDMEAFLATYSDDVQIHDFENPIPSISGKHQLRAVYEDVFEESPTLHATIQSRIVFHNKVIDDEVVTGRKGVDWIRVVVIYEVEKDEISRVTFIRK